MFIKLKKTININEFSAKTSVMSYADKIKFSNVDIPSNDIFSLVPERYRDKFIVMMMEMSESIGPHTDSDILATINIYVDPDDCTTTFYNINDNIKPPISQIKNQTNGKVFNPSQLTPYDSFIAKKDEAWLLDVTKPHSVKSNKIDDPRVHRTAIGLYTKFYSFEQVKEFLKETGYL